MENEGKVYYCSFDILRVICIVLLIFAAFGMPVPYSNYVRPYLNTAAGILFTLYGFIVLRDGAELERNIKHAFKVFVLLFTVYGLMTMAYLYIIERNPFAYFTKRGIFNFVVLNYWGANLGSSIWYVQSTLYALIIFRLFRGLKKLDVPVCILLFVITALTGELAAAVGFSFLGNTYIPGNFLTRAMPYMLLGRLAYKYHVKKAPSSRLCRWLIIGGLLLSAAEYFALKYIGRLGYTNHLLGFIPVSAGACLLAAKSPDGGKLGFGKYAGKMYRGMYYVYNPLGNIIVLAGIFVSRSVKTLSMFDLFAGLATAVICFAVFFVRAKIAVENEPLPAEAQAEPEKPEPLPEEFSFDGKRREKEQVADFEVNIEKLEKPVSAEFEFVAVKPKTEDNSRFDFTAPRREKEQVEDFEVASKERKKEEITDFKL